MNDWGGMEMESAAKVAQARNDAQGVAPADFFGPTDTREAVRRREEDLHICPSCASDLVYPSNWSPAPGRAWAVDLRCPECEWTGGGTYSQRVVDRFDEVLDLGTDSILDDLEVLSRATMEEHVEIFAAALWDDHVLPEDF